MALTVYYVDSHRYKKLSRQSILQNLNLNAVYTTKLFQKELGFSINYYIQHVKLTEAKHLLLQTNMSVTEIAHKLQFYDKSAFSKAFKKNLLYLPVNIVS
ncbi:AraC family transcriptional regulator [Lactiplantibacillus plantarum]|nr:AraC family transcriptional regulator [Lactiplantibacillus plantarum]